MIFPCSGYRRSGFLLVLLLAITPLALWAQGAGPAMKIAVVDMNSALNTSSAGKRSRNILLASKKQTESELKAKDQDLKKQDDDLKNNIMLSDEARSTRKQEIRKSRTALRTEVQAAQKDLQDKERKLTESIFTELKTIIRLIAKKENYDLVIEQGASQVILFSKFKMVDITDQVIKRYDGLNK